MAAALAAVALSGDVLAGDPVASTEVVVTLKAPALSAFGRSLQSTSHRTYARQITAAQDALATRIRATIPGAELRWRYRLVANGFAVVVPHGAERALARIPGVAAVWPNVRYHSLRVAAGPEQIGADKLWGPTFATAGNGMKIGIIDDGIDASNPYFDPSGFTYPPGFPKGQTQFATAKVIVQRTFTPASPTWKYASRPFDPTASFHATHVAGIAAGDHGTQAGNQQISGVAPNAQLGNYKALTIPTPSFGLDGNSAELAAAVEAAVSDGMNVINLSLGEPEIEPSRDLLLHAIEGAAAAGVVPVVAAGNDFEDFGYGSISSPANAPSAISVAAADARNVIAGFSSAGPTPMSLQMKPDITAPGVSVVSSLPQSDGTFGLLSGTSMAAPHAAGAAALLKERHPAWTVAQIKSALVLTGDPVRTASGAEASTVREGGGMIDLPRADVPLIFTQPTGLSFDELSPGAGAIRSVTVSDAGGGAGDWALSTIVQQGAGSVAVPATLTVPGTFTVTATAGQSAGDVTGFVVLTHGTDVRRIPFWFAVSAPSLGAEKKVALARAGTYRGTTAGGPSLVSRYRYPTGDTEYPGPERAYRVRITGKPANFGVVVTSGHAVPHVTFDGSEDRLAGYVALPLDLNPYRKSYGAPVKVSGVDAPAAGVYDIVFDTRSAGQAGPFTFRYWVNDVKPPTLRATGAHGGIIVRATDAGSGVDPSSVAITLDGHAVTGKGAPAALRIAAAKGRHTLVVTASDYQEAKNMENVPPILPNTATLRISVVVR